MSALRDEIVRAIHARSVAELRYQDDRELRLVHPHVLYLAATGEECVDCYQTAGPSHHPLPGWRELHVREITHFVALDVTFELAPGYNPDSPKYGDAPTARAR